METNGDQLGNLELFYRNCESQSVIQTPLLCSDHGVFLLFDFRTFESELLRLNPVNSIHRHHEYPRDSNWIFWLFINKTANLLPLKVEWYLRVFSCETQKQKSYRKSKHTEGTPRTYPESKRRKRQLATSTGQAFRFRTSETENLIMKSSFWKAPRMFREFSKNKRRYPADTIRQNFIKVYLGLQDSWQRHFKFSWPNKFQTWYTVCASKCVCFRVGVSEFEF